MENTLQITFRLADDLHDLLLARLSEFDFNAFEQEAGVVKAYGPGQDWSPDARNKIRRWLADLDEAAALESERWISPQNWNEQWARQIEPISVGPFLITPSWYDVPETFEESRVIEIDPKMTFGTGHHESTRLALRLLTRHVQSGDVVLDAGAGTGILSVAAVRSGASRVAAFDNHPAARDHALEVIERNDVEGAITYHTGEIDVVEESGFDGILANINRNVLIELLPAFKSKLRPGGWIILSGLMGESRSSMEAALDANGLESIDELAEGEWYAVVASKVHSRRSKVS